VEQWDIVPKQNPLEPTERGLFPDPVTGLYLLHHSKQVNGEVLGDIILLAKFILS